MAADAERGSVRAQVLPVVAVLRGGNIGLIVGVTWTAIVGPLTHGPPSILLSFVIYVTGLTLTGLLVGLVQRWSVLVGMAAGFLVLSFHAIIFGPKDGFILLWLIVFGGSGLICGVLVGAIFQIGQMKQMAYDTTLGEPQAKSPDLMP